MKIQIKPNMTSPAYVRVTLTDTREHAVCEVENGITTLSLGIEGATPLTRRRFINLMRRVITEAKARKLAKLTIALDDLRALMGFAPVRDDPAFDPPLDACALHADQPTDPKS
jgi:hypothetical protein